MTDYNGFTVPGVDVSQWQRPTEMKWVDMAAAGLRVAVIRANVGTGAIDPAAAGHARAAAAAGLEVAPAFLLRPSVTAGQLVTAGQALVAASGKTPPFFWLDLEPGVGFWGPVADPPRLVEWWAALHAALNAPGLLYGPTDFVTAWHPEDLEAHYLAGVAHVVPRYSYGETAITDPPSGWPALAARMAQGGRPPTGPAPGCWTAGWQLTSFYTGGGPSRIDADVLHPALIASPAPKEPPDMLSAIARKSNGEVAVMVGAYRSANVEGGLYYPDFAKLIAVPVVVEDAVFDALPRFEDMLTRIVAAEVAKQTAAPAGAVNAETLADAVIAHLATWFGRP
jgi:hypothetical protein